MSGIWQSATELLGPFLGNPSAGGSVGGGAGPLGGLTNLANRGAAALGMSGNPVGGSFTPMSSLNPAQQQGVMSSVPPWLGGTGPGNPVGSGMQAPNALDPNDPRSAVDPLPDIPLDPSLSAFGVDPSTARWAGVGSVGSIYLNYLAAKRLAAANRRIQAPEHTTPVTQMPPLNLQQPMQQFQLPQFNG